MKRFVISDIHGRAKAARQALERSGFDNSKDQLIFLGDAVDYGEDVPGVLNFLSEIRDLIWIRGNHDDWMIDYLSGRMEDEEDSDLWRYNGGTESIVQYLKVGKEEFERHRKLISSSILYYIDESKNDLYIHAGFRSHISFRLQNPGQLFMWDRTLVTEAYKIEHFGGEKQNFGDFNEIFLGHTPIQYFSKVANEQKPQKFCNINLMDTLAKHWTGRVSVMNTETKEIWQSDEIYLTLTPERWELEKQKDIEKDKRRRRR